MFTLDTNVLVYYLDEEDVAVETLTPIIASPSPVYFSTISELELLSLPSLSFEDFHEIGKLIRRLNTIALDSRIARIASTIRRRVKLKTPDAAIAATAIATGTTLITRNVKDFEKVPNLSIQSI